MIWKMKRKRKDWGKIIAGKKDEDEDDDDDDDDDDE